MRSVGNGSATVPQKYPKSADVAASKSTAKGALGLHAEVALPCCKATLRDGDTATADLVGDVAQSRIASYEKSIARIRVDISVLGATLNDQVAEARRLETSARSTADSARRKQRRNNILLAFAGVPASTMAAKIIIDGRSYSDLDAGIRAASQKRTDAEADVTAFDEMSRRAAKDLQRLERTQKRLERTLDIDDPLRSNATTVRLAKTARRLERRQKLAANLKEQLAILSRLKGRGLAIQEDLDGVIAELGGLVAKAEALQQRAEKEFFEVVEAMMGEDPQRALTKLVQGRVKGYVKKALRARGLSKELVDHLMKRARVDDAETRRAAIAALEA